MKKLIVSLFAGMLVVFSQARGNAQEMLIAPEGMETEGSVPELALPEESGTEGSILGESSSASADSWDEELVPYAADHGHVFLCDNALMESTGTWLRRGFWYAETDAVIYNRKWSRIPVTLGAQLTGLNIGTGPFQQQLRQFNRLAINPYRPGAEAAPRLTLGHFLFRDGKNRDHVAEFTAFGGGQWTQRGSLDANPNTDLVGTVFEQISLDVPTPTDGGNLSFDTAQNMNFRYDGRINSFELNYLVKDRMGHDRLELEPSGHWVRRAGTGLSRHFLAGIRFVDITDDLVWNASGIDPDGDDTTQENVEDDNGFVLINTDNDLFGTQVGFGCSYETARWSAGIKAKGGMFVNIVDLDTTFFRTQNIDETQTLDNNSLETDELSFVGEAALIGKWHLRPNFSLRASMEILFVSSNAFAPSQLPQALYPEGPPVIDTGGESTFLGGAIGFEGYW